MMINSKKISIRTCIGTNKKLPKNEMIRFIKLEKDGVELVTIDSTGKLPGRGANVSMDIDAFDLAIKKNALYRSLLLQKPLSPEAIQQLREDFIIEVEKRKFRKGNKPVVFKVKKKDLEEKLGK